MNWLTSLPTAVLVAAWVAIALAAAGLGRFLARVVVPVEERDQVHGVTAPLMPALGATFAVLIAVTLSSEAGYLRDARNGVSLEAAAASRLAWAATSPTVATEPIHAALRDYLRTTRADEWRDDRAAEGAPSTERAIRTMETAVRTEAARAELGTPPGTELLTSLDAVTSARRVRLAAASRQIPALYLITLVAAGLTLVGTAGALAFRASVRTSVLIGGLAVVVGLSLALLLALGAPWRGALIVDGDPLDSVLTGLESGFFDR